MRALLPTLTALALCACASNAPVDNDAGSTVDSAVDALDVTQDDASMEATDAVIADSPDTPGDTGVPPPRLKFGVFGDVRPPAFNDTAEYPTAIVTAVMDGLRDEGAQFAIGTGDYAFAYNTATSVIDAQLDQLLGAEQHFPGHVYHAMGNHECTTGSTSNCPLANESSLVTEYRARLAPDQPAPYFDWTVPTPLGDAHFIATAPNAWSDDQARWLQNVLARPAMYTVVIAHEPPTSSTVPPGTAPIDMLVSTRPGGVTLKLYGHVHYYRRAMTNALVVGNAGAPLNGTGSAYGFVTVEQRDNGDLAVTAFDLGTPLMVRDAFVLHPDGSAGP